MREKRPYSVGYVTLLGYRDEEKSCGITGTLWPTKRRVQITLDTEIEKSDRPTFASLRSGEESGRVLEKGGILRMRLFPNGVQGNYTTDWPNVLTWNEAESAEKMRFGQGCVKTSTPRCVVLKRNWLISNPKGLALVDVACRKDSSLTPQMALEKVLQEQMVGEVRYTPFISLYSPEDCLKGNAGTPPSQVKEALSAYFSDPVFRPREKEDSLPFRPVKPHLLIRSLDNEGQLLSYQTFNPGDAEYLTKGRRVKKIFLDPEACAEKVIEQLSPCEQWDILPCRIYTYSTEQMRMGTLRSAYSIQKIAVLQKASIRWSEQGFLHPVVRPIGIHLAQGDSLVAVETLYAERFPGIDPILLTENGTLTPAPLCEERNALRCREDMWEKDSERLRLE